MQSFHHCLLGGGGPTAVGRVFSRKRLSSLGGVVDRGLLRLCRVPALTMQTPDQSGAAHLPSAHTAVFPASTVAPQPPAHGERSGGDC